jgi:histone-lysine N-methyltransferase SETD2/UMP-CMP kinase
MIEHIIKELKKELGIIEGQIKIPIIYLKRLIMKLYYFCITIQLATA